MRIDTKREYALDRHGISLDQENDNSLAEAADLLYDVLNGSYACSGNCLEAEYDGDRADVQNLYWRCAELLEKASQGGDRTCFLSMSILEQTWERARPLCLCSLEKMLGGDFSVFEKAKRLGAILEDNPYKKIWAEKSRLYAGILENIGFDPDPGAFQDLTRIMDPLLDALSFYHGEGHNRPAVYRIRSGRPADTNAQKSPAIARAMSLYRSEKEFVDAAMSVDEPCILAFGAVEKTHAQVKDYFSEWFYGYPEERQRNLMRHEHLTAEQYLAMPCDYTRRVYLCVKSGGDCYLVKMPWKGDTYSRIGDKAGEYYYGKRASYAPYQVFYNNTPPAPPGSNMLAIKQESWLLSDLMDPMSMAWYPAFLDETVKAFFQGSVPEYTDLVLPEETAARLPDDKDGKDAYAIVPVHSGPPALCSWEYEVQPPEALFQGQGWLLELMRHFNVAPGDAKGVPLLPESPGKRPDLEAQASKRLKDAYVKILAERIADLLQGRWDLRKWCVDRMREKQSDIIEQAGAGDLMGFMTVSIDGTPIHNPDGSVKLVQRNRRPWDMVPDTIKNSRDDARESYHGPYRSFAHLVAWASEPVNSRPPVVWKLRPSESSHYSKMLGVPEEGLPETLRLSGPLSRFYKEYGGRLPGSLTNEWTAKGYGDPEAKSCYVPCFCALNICLSKKGLKAFPYFNKSEERDAKKKNT